MCGIAGLLHWGAHPDAADRAKKMAAAIRHRGPDDEGFWSDRDVALGFARLSIVDLAGGAQPMCNEDGRVWVVYNGEIYNHRALRRELEALGHRFKTDHSDTEVLVHGWEQWGERLVPRLNGMFAFALWDAGKQTLFLARDRYGIKPLYLSAPGNEALAFGSEVRALFASGLVEKQGSPQGLLEYLGFQNNWDGRTPFAGVEMLPPGCYETVTRGGRRRTAYWDYAFPRRIGTGLEETSVRYREVLTDVMRRQMDADVPVMTYLSGGIDSTAVTAAAHHLNREVKAYSCIFDLKDVGEDRFVDEREFSRAAAAALGIAREELELPQDALVRSLDATIGALEYPRMGMAYVNYLIAQRVARDAKVVLSGMGGDELTGGYVGRYQITPRLPALAPRGLARIKAWLRGGSDAAPAADPFAAYRESLNFLIPERDLERALTPEFLRSAGGFSARAEMDRMFARCPSRDPWDLVQYVDAKTYLHGLLVLEDKLSMAHSLETRVPLLDNELVDLDLDLPWALLNDGVTGKIVFREAVRPWVPDSIYAKPKMGFGPPDASWYRGALRPWVEERLAERQLAARGVFRPEYVRHRLDEHMAGTANHVAFLWSMLSLESWFGQAGVFGGAL
jgi:asparagine synthase (glutamine-hydrolysing)